MIDPTNDADVASASNALQAWFESQELTPHEAGLIMHRLIAKLYTERTKNIFDLAQAAQNSKQLLLIEIAGFLGDR